MPPEEANTIHEITRQPHEKDVYFVRVSCDFVDRFSFSAT